MTASPSTSTHFPDRQMGSPVPGEFLIAHLSDIGRNAPSPTDMCWQSFRELFFGVGLQMNVNSRSILSATGFLNPPGVSTSTRAPRSALSSSSSPIRWTNVVTPNSGSTNISTSAAFLILPAGHGTEDPPPADSAPDSAR